MPKVESNFFRIGEKLIKRSVVEDGYTTSIFDVYEKIDGWIEGQPQPSEKEFIIDDNILISKLKSYYGFDIDDDAEKVLARYYKYSGGKDQVVKSFTPHKVN